MLGITDIWLFIAAGLLLNLTPGPDLAFVIGRSAQRGWHAGAAAALGIGAGCFVHIVAGALGVSAVLATSATAFTVLKLIGAAYLVWIGLSMVRAAGRPLAIDRDAPPVTSWVVFRQGFLTNVLNPKVALFFLAFLPQFIAADAAVPTLSFVVLGLIFNVTGTAWNLLVAWGSARMAAMFGAASSVRTWIEHVLGSLFVLLGVRFALLQRSA